MVADEDTVQRDFSERLHELRMAQMQRLPQGAETILHGGASGGWYFRWFDELYGAPVDRHIAIEAFVDRPDDLPDNVAWHRRTLGDMGPVANGEVDLIFAGQVIEHLWPEDVAGFLLEAHRVLRDGGHLVLDSPNRVVTEAVDWLHPQHTVEFSVEEAVRLLRLAGFDVETVRGILLAYDRETRTYIRPDDGDDVMTWERRAAEAEDRPEDSFIWWIVARRGARHPNGEALLREAHERFEAFRARRMRRLQTPLSVVRETHGCPRVAVPGGDPGPLFHGPYIPLDAGAWRVGFLLRLEAADAAGHAATPAGWIDVVSDAGKTVHARRELTVADLRSDGSWTAVTLDVELPVMLMGAELRAFTYGLVALGAQLTVALSRVAQMPAPPSARPWAETPAAGTPEPRTVELLAMLRRRATARTRRLLRG